jgi:hypothetical protein
MTLTRLFSRALRKQSVSQRAFWPLIPEPLNYGRRGCLLAIVITGIIIIGSIFSPGFVNLFLNGGALIALGSIGVVNGAFQGAISAVRIGSLLANLRERGQYDLLCLLPPGAARVTWELCTTCLHRTRTFSSLSSELVWVVRSIFILATVLIIARENRNPWQGPFLAMTQIGLMYVIFHIDDIQSLIVGSLSGMIAPTFTRTPADARLYSLLGYLLIQTATYLLVVLATFVALPALYRLLHWSGLAADFLQSVIGILTLYSFREVIIRALWQTLLRRLDIYPADQPQFR